MPYHKPRALWASPTALLCLIAATPVDAQTAQAVPGTSAFFLCQMGDRAELFTFVSDQSGQWFSQGRLQDWNVTAQPAGWVARRGEDVLILDGKSASLLEGGQLLKGQCVDAQTDLTPLLQSSGNDGANFAVPEDAARQSQNDPDQMISLLLSLLDPEGWDATKVGAVIDAMNLDLPAKTGLRAQLKAAASDPQKIAAIAKNIRAAFAEQVAVSSNLQDEVVGLQRQLDATSQDLNETRQKANQTIKLLSRAEANVRAAEKARNDMAAQVRGLQDALTRSQADGQKLKATLSTVVTQLSVAQANLAFVQAN